MQQPYDPIRHEWEMDNHRELMQRRNQALAERNVQPYDAPCGCFLHILPGGIIDQRTCYAHHMATYGNIVSRRPT